MAWRELMLGATTTRLGLRGTGAGWEQGAQTLMMMLGSSSSSTGSISRFRFPDPFAEFSELAEPTRSARGVPALSWVGRGAGDAPVSDMLSRHSRLKDANDCYK